MYFWQKPLLSICIVFCVFMMTKTVSANNNIEFLKKELISTLNQGIFEVVTPKRENDNLQYARKLPFDRLDFIERNEKYHSIGTAFFINDTDLMTAAHVLSLRYFSLLHDFYIRNAEGEVFPIGMIKRYSTLRDMAVFDLKRYPKQIIPLKFSTDVSIGDTVFSVGNAQGEGIAYRAGQVASFTPEREFGKWKDIRFTSPASPGNSGGPLLNLGGEVVGLIVKKNESENYNISVPIDELEKLTNDAEFIMRNISLGLVGVDDTLTRDWTFSITLPATVEEVAQQAQNSLNDHMRQLGNDLMDSVKDKNFPHGERFRSYLRNQTLVNGFALLLPETKFNKWSVKSSFRKKIPITAGQNVYRGRSYSSDLQVIVEKPEGTSLKEFIESPEMVMDNLLKAVSFTRAVADEKIPMTSFGEPENTTIITDDLGRKWISSLWNHHHTDSFVYSSCLPYPKGVICNIDSKSSSYRNYGFFHDTHDAYNETVVGYMGEIDDWIEYFTLDKTYLPEIFNTIDLKFTESTLHLKLEDYAIEFASPKITGESTIHFHLGYSNEKLFAEDLLLFKIFPEKGGKEEYRVQPFYEPSPFSPDSYQSEWKDVLAGSGDYSGKAINKSETISIRKTFEATNKTISSPKNSQIKKIYTAGCTYKVSEEHVEDDCSSFLDSITFH